MFIDKHIKFLIIIFLFIIHSAEAQESFYLVADKIIKNDKKNIILAKGNVQLQYQKTKILANSLEYNTMSEQIILDGDIKILYEDGSVVFANKASLDKNLKNGVIKRLGVLMSDESRLVASSAKKESQQYKTVYNSIAYTRCDNCENNDGTFWKLNAKKATHLEKSKVILYEDVYLEVLGVPLIYFPFFYHPDPSVKRKTGLLAPKFSRSNVFGVSYEQPVYFNLSPYSDLTVETKFTELEGILLKKNFRKKYSSGELELISSITRGTKVRENEITKKENRGHLDLKFANNLGNGFNTGGNIKKASDKSYLSRYGLSDGETLLTQNLFVEKKNTYSEISGQIFKFQSLSNDYLEDNLPFIKPLLSYNWNNLWNTKRKINSNSSLRLKSITKRNNKSVNAIYLSNNIEKSFTKDHMLIKSEIDVDADFYNTNLKKSNYQNTSRFFPSVALTASYPTVKFKNNKSILLEPITKVIYTLNNNKEEKIVNEDSLEVELLSSNFLTKNKYSGDDRKEHGLRINYGVNLRFRGENGSSDSFTIGRSYYQKKQEKFDKLSGFKNKHSDLVGNYTSYFSNNSIFYYDFRLANNFTLNRNRLRANLFIEDNILKLNYTQIKNFASRNNSDTELINYGFSSKILKNWTVEFNQQRDLAGANFSTPFKSSISMIFQNECSSIKFNITRDKSHDIDIPATTNYNFIIKLF